MEYVVFGLDRRVAHVPAVGGTRIGRERVGRGVIVEERVSPSGAVRKSLAVLFDEKSLREGVRHIHHKGGLRTLFRLPLELRDLGAVGERLAIARNAGP